MAHLGGGAEAHARFKQYEYRANSSLVLTTDSRPRDTHEPTGEPESLWGKIDPKSFGDRAYRGKPPELEEKIKKSKKKKEREPGPDHEQRKDSKARRAQEETVLSLADEGVYQPKTKVTRAAYEALLSIIGQQRFGGQPPDVLTGAADEVLGVLKNDKIKNPEKKKDIERLLNPFSSQTFDQLVSIARLITDYQDGPQTAGNDGALDDDIVVAVEFEEDDEEESGYDHEIQEESGEDDDGQKPNHMGAVQVGGIDDEEMEETNEGRTLDARDIDAYWLQRKISQAFENIDPLQSQKIAEDVLKIMAEGDDRDVENRLVTLLEYDKFDLIKLLLRNRLKIIWCTRLARVKDQEQRKEIEEEMMNFGPSLTSIWEELHATRASAKEHQKNLERSIRDEASRLKDDRVVGDDRDQKFMEREADDIWLMVVQRPLLDLETLAFQKGGLLMANNKCELPPIAYRTPHKGFPM